MQRRSGFNPQDAIVTHVDHIKIAAFPCHTMRMAEANSGIALPFSQYSGDFVCRRIDASNGAIFVIGNEDVVGIINAQMLG